MELQRTLLTRNAGLVMDVGHAGRGEQNPVDSLLYLIRIIERRSVIGVFPRVSRARDLGFAAGDINLRSFGKTINGEKA